MVILRQRRDTEANWTTNNPIIPDGQLCFDMTNHTFRIGNGVDAYLSLPIISGGGGGGATLDGLDDTDTSDKTGKDGYALAWDNGSSKYVLQEIPTPAPSLVFEPKIDSSVSALAFRGYIVDSASASGAVTISLPNAVHGDMVEIKDIGGMADSKNIILQPHGYPSGQSLAGSSANRLTVNVNYAYVRLLYTTTRGWIMLDYNNFGV